MPSEHQSCEEAHRLLGWLPLRARTQQREQHDGREQSVCKSVRATMHVTARTQYVHRQREYQQAGHRDVRGLKVPVARPNPRAH